ncbi:MAG: hypothetical protein KKI12_01320 [Proteobacteria bacterium]|nr:hypothetical protein [Pseudomonadota bacterium]MBU4258124.1 hypothetical protein [Pseudomonadota bacterium]MBU4286796.1 hypothetical protein [Pseudomonadota bacterium]MBU4413632.1 hypothetical protein [Pseudomonadota bacterium]MCG2758604.1 hypothetical protein [Desulfobacteraceae bacterium]
METRENEFFTRNSELSMEFSKYVLEHPEMDDLLTEEAVVVFLPEFDAELADFNSRMAKEIEGEGGRVLYVKVKQMAPKIFSRLMGVEVGVARSQLEH